MKNANRSASPSSASYDADVLSSSTPARAGVTPLSLLVAAISLALLAPLLSGCTDTMLASARSSIAAGNYAQAHQDLEAALRNPSLGAAQRREVKDDLCATEVEIGAPTYSLWRQQRTCAEAAGEPGSSSGERLAKIDQDLRQQEEAQFQRSLHDGDIGQAVASLQGYAKIAPGDRQNIAAMEKRLWAVVDRRDQVARRHRKKVIRQVLVVLDDDYPGLHAMNQRAFKSWIGRDTSPAGVPMLSAIAITGHTLELTVPHDNLKQSAIAPETFARINDAFSVWCQCDGATHVAVDSNGLPVYLARINLLMSRSEVLVLPRP